jgi:hypothetical protein
VQLKHGLEFAGVCRLFGLTVRTSRKGSFVGRLALSFADAQIQIARQAPITPQIRLAQRQAVAMLKNRKIVDDAPDAQPAAAREDIRANSDRSDRKVAAAGHASPCPGRTCAVRAVR